MKEFVDYALIAYSAACYQGFAHYFPWKRLNGGKMLSRPANYVIGLIGILVPVVAKGLTNHMTISLWHLLLSVAVSGLTVLGCYAVDVAIENKNRSEQVEKLHDQIG